MASGRPTTTRDRAYLRAQSNLFMSVGTGFVTSFIISIFFANPVSLAAIAEKGGWLLVLLVATVVSFWLGFDSAQRAEED